MNSVMMKRLLLGLTVSCASVAFAKSGEVGITQCTGSKVQNVETTPQVSFGMGEAYGTIRADPAGGLFDMMSSHCLGAARVVEGKPFVWGHCEWTDKDGDKVLLHYVRSEGLTGKYTVIHETGKFSGITGTRDYKITPFPPVAGGRLYVMTENCAIRCQTENATTVDYQLSWQRVSVCGRTVLCTQSPNPALERTV